MGEREKGLLTPEEKTAGIRFACMAMVTGDATVVLPAAAVTDRIVTAGEIPPFDLAPWGKTYGAAADIGTRYGCAVLCKGGHQLNDANDLLWKNGTLRWFNGRRIDNPNTHGTGCTLSSAIASNLAKGFDLETSVEMAKTYLSGALAAGLDLGHGSGPMDHAFDIKPQYRQEAQA